MIFVLHGYLLEGSGSNLWTRAIVRSLCRNGETVHLMCQEGHPTIYDFIAEARLYHPDGRVEVVLDREVDYPGRCVLHRPVLGDTLPVYVHDRYEDFDNVVPMVDLPESEIRAYLDRNVAVAERVVREHPIHAIHANHAVLMPQVAEAVSERTGVPFSIMPHGSAIEYAVKPDPRFKARAARSLERAGRVFVIGPEIRSRVRDVFGDVDGVAGRMRDLNLGVDTRLFEPVPPAARARSIHRLGEILAGVERGRSAADRRALAAALEAGPPADRLPDLLAEPPGDPKRPDADAESRLAGIDWGRDPVLLFLGRLIAAKGAQAVVAAVPAILRELPDARLVVVGHGPLRLPLEALVHALATADEALATRLADRPLPGAPDGMPEVAAYLRRMSGEERAALFRDGARLIRPDTVIFTGYLRHTELRYLFPACDAAVFPSMVREAGPLVFLEALSSGVLPMGTDFGGMRESLNALTGIVDADVLDALRLRPDAEHLAADIAAGAPTALRAAPRFAADLRGLAEARYDWTSVAETFAAELRSLSDAA